MRVPYSCLALVALALFLPVQANAADLMACQDFNGSTWPASPQHPCPTNSTPGSITISALAVSSVTTGGTAVTAIAAGGRTKGGWLFNPATATINLCIDETTTAVGTTSAGTLACIVPGQTYILAPSANAVSVVTSDSAHAFAGLAWN